MNIKKICILLGILFICIPSYAANEEQACLQCHSDQKKMASLGFPFFTMTAHEVVRQTKMPVLCTDCHLGNPETMDKDRAHEGLLTVQAIKDRTWEGMRRSMMKDADLKQWQTLEPRGDNRANSLLPKISFNGVLKDNPDFKMIIWHDRNAETLAFNPVLAERTCGKCHAEIVKTFLGSAMGGGKKAHTQSQYKTWTGLAGPQSCGLWAGKLAEPAQASFTNENVHYYNQHSTMPLAEKTAFDNQRRCNQCHVGCLDCHYAPKKNNDKDSDNGTHTFTKRPDPISCYGGGRSFSCHAGPLERRRGDGYIRGEFVQASAEGIKTLNEHLDIHMQKGIFCVDCHEPNKKSQLHADLQRNVDCSKCHPSEVKAHMKGPHKRVDCAACHTTLIGGYAFNFWSAIGPKGNENPLTRIQDYLVGAVSPLIIKNSKGIWIPVHVVPHTSGNVKADEVVLSEKLIFRNKPDVTIDRLYYSNDAYAVTGLVRDLDNKDNDTMVWLNFDRVAHATGKSRSCGSCHDSTTQTIMTPYTEGSYKDVGEGRYAVIADKMGIRVKLLKEADGTPMPEGLEPFKDKWALGGDFGFPEIKDHLNYEKLEKRHKKGTFVH